MTQQVQPDTIIMGIELPWGAWVALAIVAAILLAFLCFCVLVVWHFRRNRQLLHSERIKALELGQAPAFYPPDRSKERYGHNTFWVAFWVGAVVPIGVAHAAAFATSHMNIPSVPISITIWICVVPVCVASIVCATILMVSARRVATAESIKTVLPYKPTAGQGG